MFIKIPELLQQHFPSVYLCTYSIVSLLWAGHSFCSIIHLLTHFSSPSLLSFFLFGSSFVFLFLFSVLTHPPSCFYLFAFFNLPFVSSVSASLCLFSIQRPYSQNVTVNSRSNTQLHKHADGGIKVYVQ